jgi:hypothetical protein
MNLETYTINNRVFNQYDTLSNGITSLHIKRIFELYDKTYLSYDFDGEFILHTEEVELFLDTKNDFTILVVGPKTLSSEDNPPCFKG